MADYTVANLKRDVEDLAPKFGLAPQLEARFARQSLGMSQGGMSYQRLAPGFRLPFGHRHREQEEVYVVLSGSLTANLDGEMAELERWDAMRVAGDVTRSFEAGSDGAELLVFGSPRVDDTEMEPGWWSEG